MKKLSPRHTPLTLWTLPLLTVLAAALLWPISRPAAQTAANSGKSINICGVVSDYKPASASETGAISVAGSTFTIARNVSLSGVSAGSNLCFNFCFDANGHISSNSAVNGAHSGGAKICGTVTKFVQAVGGTPGLLVISGVSFSIAPALQIPGQELAVPGASVCLTPVISSGVLLSGSAIHAGSDLQFKTLTTVDGFTFDGIKDTFNIPEPTVFTVQTPAPLGTTVFQANQQNFGTIYPLGLSNPQGAGGMMLTTPNSTLRATTCTESFWDGVFQIASLGNTEGDMITFYLQKADGTNSQVIAMFTNENGEAKLTQAHPDVTVHIGGNRARLGATTPYVLAAGSSGYRTFPITLIFSMTSTSLMGCHQMVAEIKRGAGEGKTSLLVSYLQIKRMERPFDRDTVFSVGLNTGVNGWYPTGLVCDVICSSCLPPPPPAGLSGYVFCDNNDDGIKQPGEPGEAGVKITLSGTQSGEAFTNADGFYIFKDLPAGVYTLTETQPSGPMDGKDSVGTLGGDVSNDIFSNIVLPQSGIGEQYNFGEKCMTMTPKCDTVCWRATQHFLLNNSRNLPGGTVLIAGVNFNNPVGIQQNLSGVRNALMGGLTPMHKLNREFVTAQLSLAGAGGVNSPIVFNVYWSPLSCSGVSFGEVTLSNGFKFTPSSLLNDLVDQTTIAIKTGRSADYQALASLWSLLNGRC